MEANSPLVNQNAKTIVETNYSNIVTSCLYNSIAKTALENNQAQLTGRNAWEYDYNNEKSLYHRMEKTKVPSIIQLYGNLRITKFEDFALTREDFDKLREKYRNFYMMMKHLFVTDAAFIIGYRPDNPHLEDFINQWEDARNNSKIYFNGEKPYGRGYILLTEAQQGQFSYKYSDAKHIDQVVVRDYAEVREVLKTLQQSAPRN